MDLENVNCSDHRRPYEDVFDCDKVNQVIGYEDESVELFFKDRSNLQLSPCGANFRYTKPHDGPVPAIGRRQFDVTQRCVFATSETRQKVALALNIRNQLCCRPYLTAEYFEDIHIKPIRGYKNTCTIEWPQGLEGIIPEEDGSFKIASNEGHALVHLHPCKHAVVVHYNVIISSCGHAHDSEDISSTDADERLMYAVQKLIFPVSSCPPEWTYPVGLLQKAALISDICPDLSNSRQLAPQSAPKKCPNPYRHNWRNVESHMNDDRAEFTDTSIRFLWCEKNMYWFCKDVSPKIEVWMENGDIFKSHQKNERYFIHMQCKRFPSEKTTYVERIMSSAFVPVDVTLKSVMLRSIRMISYKSQRSSAKESSPCWIQKPAVSMGSGNEDVRIATPNLHATANIPALGVFSAVADSIEIKFNDGTMMHMNVVFSKAEEHESTMKCSNCRVVLNDGRYVVVGDLASAPLCAQNYINHVRAWVQWLSLTKSQRDKHPFYTGTIYDQSQMRMVQKELDKIEKATGEKARKFSSAADRFQYLELSTPPSLKNTTNCVSGNDVSAALSQTSKAIDDIDAIISEFRKSIS